jgi:peptidoglycan hydrolase-like protein with peptidoglycan-binding domain
MRVLILALSVLGILVLTNNANAGLSTATRDQSASTEPTASADPVASVDPAPATDPAASVDPAAFTDQATQQTEDQIGLDRTRRRQVQRWLTDLGFDTRANGKFDEPTRAVIARWQAARGYPNTGFLNARQHEALRTEIVTAAHADSTSSASSDDGHPAPARGGGETHHRRHGGGGGPGGLIGGVVGGLFGRR